MSEDFKNKFDLSIKRRRYYSEENELTCCPECGLSLIEDNCTVLIAVRSDTDKGEFMSNMTGSHFCESCPVVVFDLDKIEQAARIGIRGEENLQFIVLGIVNFNAIPVEKRHIEIGTDDNPLPLVYFLPDIHKPNIVKETKIRRNDPCSCGSGKKYKKCCE